MPRQVRLAAPNRITFYLVYRNLLFVSIDPKSSLGLFSYDNVLVWDRRIVIRYPSIFQCYEKRSSCFDARAAKKRLASVGTSNSQHFQRAPHRNGSRRQTHVQACPTETRGAIHDLGPQFGLMVMAVERG